MAISNIIFYFLVIKVSSGFTSVPPKNQILTPRRSGITHLSQVEVHSHISTLLQSSKKNQQNVGRGDFSNVDITKIEKEVAQSARAKLDIKTVQNALIEPMNESDLSNEDGWRVPVAAGILSFFGTFTLIHSLSLASIAFIFTFIVASGDPLEEEGYMGALARVVGRQTLTSFEASKPKVKSVIRASIQGDEELFSLRERVNALEKENKDLRLWIEHRNYVDRCHVKYTMNDLRVMARDVGLNVPGNVTKSRLMMKLLEKGVITMES